MNINHTQEEPGLLDYKLIREQGKKNGSQRIKEVNKLTASPYPS